MNNDTPKFPDDYFFYRWIRASSKTLFGTGKMLRSMESYASLKPDFEGNDDMEKYSNNFGTDKVQ